MVNLMWIILKYSDLASIWGAARDLIRSIRGDMAGLILFLSLIIGMFLCTIITNILYIFFIVLFGGSVVIPHL